MNYQDPRDGGRRRSQGDPSRRRSAQGEPSRQQRARQNAGEAYSRAESRPAPRSSSMRQNPRPTGDRSARQAAREDARNRQSARSNVAVRRSARGPESVRPSARASAGQGRGAEDASMRRARVGAPVPTYNSNLGNGRPSRRRGEAYVTPSMGGSKVTNWVAVVGGVLALFLVAFVFVKIPGMISPKQPELTAEQAAAAAEAEKKAAADRQAALDASAAPITFTMSFTGDCIIANGDNFAYERSLPEKYDEFGPGYFFENVKSIFQQDDYTVVDMECTLTDSTDRTYETFAFKADPSYVEILTLGDVQAGTLANNHTHDFGEKSYTDTWNTLEKAGIVPFGYDDIAYVDIKGVKVALIGVYELDEYLGIMDNMLENIQKAKDNGATVTIVFQHWGEEKMYVPDTDQVTLGHAAIDAGADLVVGCHPHRVQGIEKYNGRYIAYSMGNFCFGGNNAPADMDCYIFQQTFTVRGKTVEVNDNINVIPCSISSVEGYNNYQPTPATGEEAERIMAKIDEISQEIPKI